jgi:hypothetical protein
MLYAVNTVAVHEMWTATGFIFSSVKAVVSSYGFFVGAVVALDIQYVV